MNARKNYLMIVATVVVVVAFVGINGCEKSSDADAKAACCPSCGQAKDAASVALCTKCGQIKGSDLCCKLD